MTQNTTIWVRRIYFALITVALITAAVLLMVQCVAIYRLGGAPFTRERVAEYFAPIAVPVYACLGLVVAGIALSPLLPAAPDSKPDRDGATLRRLQEQADLSAGDATTCRQIRSLQRTRRCLYDVTLALLAVGAVIFLWYALDLSHFSTEDINGSMIAAMLLLLPCVGVPALFALFTAYYCRRSVRKEIDLLRTIPKVSATPKVADLRGQRWMPYAQSALVIVAVALIVVGLLENGAAAVLTKAINICTECIGLG